MHRFAAVVIAVVVVVSCRGRESASPIEGEDEDLPIEAIEPAVLFPGFRAETIARDLGVVWGMAFDNNGRLYFTEREGRIARLRNGVIETVADASAFPRLGGTESGLLDLALDPLFPTVPHLYVCFTELVGPDEVGAYSFRNQVRRFTLAGNTLVDPTPVLADIPSRERHAGCRLAFDDDANHLFVTMGETYNGTLAQDLDDLRGKILRINADGSIPDDNPFPWSAIWSYGHRNPQGLAFHPDTGLLFSTEHGEGDDDEFNLIQRGGNHGWPIAHGTDVEAPYVPALLAYTPTIAISGLAFYDADLFADWRGRALFASLRAGELHLVQLDARNAVIDDTILIPQTFGRLRTVIVGPDGAIYVSTSNRGDRTAEPAVGENRIYRLSPL